MKHKLKVTLTIETEVDTGWYGEGIDASNITEAYKNSLDENPELVEFLIEKEFTVAAELIE